MSLIIKTAKTTPIRIDIDLQTNEGQIKGHFTGHAFIRSKPQLLELQKRIDAITDDATATALEREEKILREMYEKFDGLADESGELTGDAAFGAMITGPLSVHLTQAATEAYWAFLSGEKRQGNSRRQPAR
jgi:hypothetical protein